MKLEDVQVNMKVIPHNKTVEFHDNWEAWSEEGYAGNYEDFKNQGYLTIYNIDYKNQLQSIELKMC